MANPNNAPATHAGLFTGFGAFTPNVDVQVFLPAQLSQLLPAGNAGQTGYGVWQKPKGVVMCRVVMVGHGGGGGSGRKGSTITVCCGGGGGASGNYLDYTFAAADLPDEVPVTVPCGSAGGLAQSTNDTNGNTGNGGSSASNTTYFGIGADGTANRQPILVCRGGFPGAGGTASSGSGGLVVSFGGLFAGIGAPNASTTGGAGTNGNGAFGAPGSGGSGAGLTSGNLHSAGGNGGQVSLSEWQASSPPAAAGGTAGGGNGQNAYNGLWANEVGFGSSAPSGLSVTVNGSQLFLQPGGGGGGGGSANSGDAVSGGNGGNGLWGSGAGGGGAATDTTSPNSGAGGNGGDAFIIVMSW